MLCPSCLTARISGMASSSWGGGLAGEPSVMASFMSPLSVCQGPWAMKALFSTDKTGVSQVSLVQCRRQVKGLYLTLGTRGVGDDRK